MKMHYVYVLQSAADCGLYIGETGDLRRRLAQHHAGESRATARRRPFELIYYEAYRLRKDAEGRERFLKSGAGRRYLAKHVRIGSSVILRSTPREASPPSTRMAELAYGSGLRLMELLRLRVHHLDLDRRQLRVIAGKGDRVNGYADAMGA